MYSDMNPPGFPVEPDPVVADAIVPDLALRLVSLNELKEGERG